jgi:tetratricopeptide (TPR) repeat protein
MLLTQETNIYLKAGKKEEALKNLNEAIEADPNNATFYFARGAIYNELGELDKAIEDYKKAIELDEKYFDAYYNLGALYFNQAAEYFNKIQTITDNTKYQEEKKKADEMFQKALPYLEKAHELNPTDKPTMQSLKQLYVRTGNMDKYNEIKEKLQN